MIQGVGTRHASQSRAPTEARIIAARAIGAVLAAFSPRTQVRSGRRPSAARSVAKPDLTERTRDLAQLSVAVREPDVRHRFRNLAEDRVLNERTARPLLKRGAVKLRDSVERMFPIHV